MPLQILLINCYLDKKDEKIRPYCLYIEETASAQGFDASVSVVDDTVIASGRNVPAHDAVIISGSGRMLSENEYLPEVLEFICLCAKPLLGICYGHQLLARALGATVSRDERSHQGDEEIVLKTADLLFEGFPDKFMMRQNHEEVVEENAVLSKSFELLAVNAEGKVEAIRHRSLPLRGVQFHPERSGEHGQRLLTNFLKQIYPHPD